MLVFTPSNAQGSTCWVPDTTYFHRLPLSYSQECQSHLNRLDSSLYEILYYEGLVNEKDHKIREIQRNMATLEDAVADELSSKFDEELGRHKKL